MDLLLFPEPDEPTRRAVATALARFAVAVRPTHQGYASRWRLAGLAEGVGAADGEDGVSRGYGCSPRSMRGVTRA